MIREGKGGGEMGLDWINPMNRHNETHMATEFWSAAKLSAESVFEALLVASVGVFLGWKGLLDKSGRNVISMLCVEAFVPALVFDKLCRSVSVKDIVTWWAIPVNVLASILMGGIVGMLFSRCSGIRKAHHNMFVCASALGNIGNLPLVLIHAMCTSDHSPFDEGCEERGISYVAFGMFTGTIVQWSVANVMLEAPRGGATEGCELSLRKDHGTQVSSEGDSEDMDGIQGHMERASLIDRETHVHGMEAGSTAMDGNEAVEERAAQGSEWELSFSRHSVLLKRLFTPPVIATFLALFVGAVPPLKGLLYGDGALLAPLSSAIAVVGAGMIPALLILLGSLLSDGPSSSALQKRTILLVVFVRGAVLPVLGIGFVSILKLAGCLPQDPLFEFVLLIQHALPSAIILSTIATIHDYNSLEMSSLLFYQYMAAILFMPAFLTVFLQIA